MALLASLCQRVQAEATGELQVPVKFEVHTSGRHDAGLYDPVDAAQAPWQASPRRGSLAESLLTPQPHLQTHSRTGTGPRRPTSWTPTPSLTLASKRRPRTTMLSSRSSTTTNPRQSTSSTRPRRPVLRAGADRTTPPPGWRRSGGGRLSWNSGSGPSGNGRSMSGTTAATTGRPSIPSSSTPSRTRSRPTSRPTSAPSTAAGFSSSSFSSGTSSAASFCSHRVPTTAVRTLATR